MSWLSRIFSFSLFSSAVAISQQYTTSRSHHPYTSTVLNEFGLWAENIAVRYNGDLLVTLLGPGDLYLLNPLFPASTVAPTLIHDFSPNVGLLGITEVTPDHFYIIATTNPELFGTYSVWSINLRHYKPLLNIGAEIQQVAALPEAGVLNGMTTLDASRGMVAVADSTSGYVWLLNVATGNYSILLDEPELKGAASNTSVTIGVNGVKAVHHGSNVWLYFNNMSKNLFCRVPISLSSLQKAGPVEVLQTGFSSDDFAIDGAAGIVYLADTSLNSLLKMPLGGGEVETILGGINETIVQYPTSVAKGRGLLSCGRVYVTTQTGRILAINTEG